MLKYFCLLGQLKILNQAKTGHRPASAWFLKIDPVQIVSMRVCVCVCVCVFVCVCVCICVCLCLRLLITSGMIWTSHDWLNKFYSCYMATVVVIISGRGHVMGMCHRH